MAYGSQPLPRRTDCVIIGGGPAGLTAATYLCRFHRSVRVFDDGRSRARWIPETHNCPGFPEGVSGPELLERLSEQAAGYGADIVATTISSLRRDGDRWIADDGTQCWEAPAVILATGVVDRFPDFLQGDCAQAIGRGLLRLCAICDGFEATDRVIGVIGPFENVLAHACFLRTYSPNVTAVPTTAPAVHPEAGQQERVDRAQLLGIALTARPTRLSFDDQRCHVLDEASKEHVFDTVYLALGSPGRSELARQAGLILEEGKELRTDAHMRTSISGLYAIGDVVTDLNQISVAFGHAAIAATSVHRELSQRPR